MEPSDEEPEVTLDRMIEGYKDTQFVALAARLGIADLLSDGPLTSDQAACGCELMTAICRQPFMQSLVVLNRAALPGSGRWSVFVSCVTHFAGVILRRQGRAQSRWTRMSAYESEGPAALFARVITLRGYAILETTFRLDRWQRSRVYTLTFDR